MSPSEESGDASSISSNNTIKPKNKNNRTPLKLLPLARPSAAPSNTSPRRRRKRVGGKRAVRSCTACRAAHVRCVADRYGVPCERCAKKSWLDCTLTQKQHEHVATLGCAASEEVQIMGPGSPQNAALKQIASTTLAVMAETVTMSSP
ncbi:hypothetical protein F4802DRAFT_612123 [Xylaria palmicola]|nr:hypothetical protein F4802DRAFT_612123 [Xylaria palmicola]